MELVYLWVESYKNIKKQGFNFSPRFDCKYDEEKNELTIDENKDYVNIFPENINITAIVGENGSGKSSLLKYIGQFSSLFLNKKFDIFITDPKTYIFIYYSKALKQFFILWSILDKVKVTNNTAFNIPCYILNSFKSDEYIKLLKEKKFDDITRLALEKRVNSNFNKECFSKNINELHEKLFILHYDFSFDRFTYYENDNSSILAVPNKEYDIYQHYNYDKTLVINHIISKNYIDDNKYFEPYKISIEPLGNTVNQFQYKNKLEIKDFILHLIYSTIFNLLKGRHIKINDTNKNIINNPKDLAEFISKHLKSIEKSFVRQDIKEIPLSYELEDLINYLKILNENDLNQIFQIDNTFANINVNTEYLNENNISLLTSLPSKFFKLKILSTNNVDYDDLSNGEKAILRIRFYIEKVIQKYKKKNYFILLDEADNELHPEWQKKLLNYLISIFKNRQEKFHFILTSHSPFIISDLAKENVIFLKNGREVDVEIDTFGANIHTLLSHGFFMKDGLMGEFAKEKINEVINFLNNNKSTIKSNEEAQNLINIIGEPVIKKQLQKMLDSKRLSKIDEIDLIKNQMKKLSDRLEEIENAED
ncbi:hypothetical protein CRV01_02080 [Arcobacter sp. CECT 8983]|uniref:AAA family ATPase n=1 Tax=Arcobacter sp. CECT 8983 TaxID=2044508 RepID=UPI00100AD154|nr:AAA family ATPase [Arcobacter sp. CECT 8983]RXJ91894.1 hypothetical protein CRV01_02080 [Arcobacter sp. CECT 8983]